MCTNVLTIVTKMFVKYMHVYYSNSNMYKIVTSAKCVPIIVTCVLIIVTFWWCHHIIIHYMLIFKFTPVLCPFISIKYRQYGDVSGCGLVNEVGVAMITSISG